MGIFFALMSKGCMVTWLSSAMKRLGKNARPRSGGTYLPSRAAAVSPLMGTFCHLPDASSKETQGRQRAFREKAWISGCCDAFGIHAAHTSSLAACAGVRQCSQNSCCTAVIAAGGCLGGLPIAPKSPLVCGLFGTPGGLHVDYYRNAHWWGYHRPR